MKDSIIIEGREFISVGRAAEITKYTKDYVGQLCRGGKVAARMIGRTWFIDRESLSAYKNSIDSGVAQAAHAQAVLYAENQAAKAASRVQTSPASVSIPLEKAVGITYVADAGAALPELQKAVKGHLATLSNQKVLDSVDVKLRSPAAQKAVVQIKNRALSSFSGYVPTTRHMMAVILPLVLFAVGVFGAVLPSGTISTLSQSAVGTFSKGRNTQMTASVWSSVGCGFASVLFGGSEWCSVSGSSAFVIVPSQDAIKPVVQTQVVSKPAAVSPAAISNETATSPVIVRVVERVVAQPQTTIVNQTDPSLAQRVSDLEAADLASMIFNQLQVDRIFDSIESMGGSSGSSVVDLTSIDGSTITNSSFSGSTGIFSSNVTVGGTVIVSGAGTSTISNGLEVGNLHINGTITGAGLADCAGSGDKIIWSGGSFSCGVDAGGSGLGISSLGAQYSSAQSGAVQTFATSSSDANLRLTITSSGDTHTFTPVWNGTLATNRGGTGISSVIADQILIGNSSGTGWAQIATSSLGLPTFSSLNSYLTLSNWYATTTDGLDEGIANLYFTDARVQTYLDTIGKGYFFSTTSVAYWDSTQSRWATTSSDYWLTTKSTDNLTEGSNLYFNNTRARLAVSESIDGIDYDSVSGVFSNTPGYIIPLTASTTEWSAAYANRIVSATSPLSIVNNIISLSTAGDWSGTFDGQEGGYYLNANNLTNFGERFYTYFSATNTDALAEGSNLYYTDDRVNAYIAASTTIAKTYESNVFAPAQTFTGGISIGTLNGLLYGTNGAVGTIATSTLGLPTFADLAGFSQTSWATTSSDYWLTTKSTDNLTEGVTNRYYSNALVNPYIAASTTIPKTYTANTFTNLQTFANASTTLL
ncbi:MAG: hypothetical protein KBC33_02710, partial [Candidatus Pacebacteria bacterium]|nr:hypothetical protein [Candidatus Paceibacterota bacterium]